MPVFDKNRKEPQTVDVLGNPFACPVCKHDLFYQGKAQLNSRGLTFLKLDWLNRNAMFISCAQCGHMTWFNQK